MLCLIQYNLYERDLVFSNPLNIYFSHTITEYFIDLWILTFYNFMFVDTDFTVDLQTAHFSIVNMDKILDQIRTVYHTIQNKDDDPILYILIYL